MSEPIEVISHFAGSGNVGERQAHAGDLTGQERGVRLCACDDEAIGVGSRPVALLLPILREKYQRRGIRGLHDHCHVNVGLRLAQHVSDRQGEQELA